MRSRVLSLALATCVLAWGAGCSKKPADNTTTTANQQAGQSAPDNSSQSPSATPGSPAGGTAAGNAASGGGSNAGAGSTAAQQSPAQPAAPQVITIPQGTIVSVHVGQTITSKHSHSGDQFTATLAEPIVVGNQTVADTGAEATGTVVEAVPLGKFKGGAKLRLSLDAITMHGQRYPVHTSSVEHTKKGKGKRTAGMIGGGAGLGAIIGGIAGGGKGAAIGALAGGGAGTAGAAFTGNKDLTIPAETVLSFKLLQSVDVQ
ncbi:hypothetical protein Acid345_4293 [Candidatus Koribacter versatilis Ellin345]|uniref:Lipoprotein n=1 Tax=Koribacter versatilis (strain Ellin345) TaxID=204669 RepID=Q1IIK7_KORVE|nr:hypothetical protein [Candidatus Koribacter versatilis]ABF43293.1 hypothetical protein Acid345_4293 [Candidatus Koribacter versatilis Ellin345]